MTDPRSQISKQQREKFLAFALAITDETRDIALRYFATEQLDVDYKEPGQPVTPADREIEVRLRERIQAAFPEHGILGEEFGLTNPEAEFQWTLDPIDGTRNFAAGIDTFGNMIALRFQNKPLLGVLDHPARNVCVHGTYELGSFREQSGGRKRLAIQKKPELAPIISTSNYDCFARSGHGITFERLLRKFQDTRLYYDCYAHTLTALNCLQATVEYNVKLWDIAPTEIIIEEAGGKYLEVGRTTKANAPTLYRVIFGEPDIVQEIAAFLVPEEKNSEEKI